MRPARGTTDDDDDDDDTNDDGYCDDDDDDGYYDDDGNDDDGYDDVTNTHRCLKGGSGKADVIAPQSVTLVSAQGDSFQVDGKVAMMSELVKTMIGGIEDEGEDGSSNGSGGSGGNHVIPLPNVTTEVLAKVIEFCNHYVDHPVAPIQKPIIGSDMKQVSRSSRKWRGVSSGVSSAVMPPPPLPPCCCWCC